VICVSPMLKIVIVGVRAFQPVRCFMFHETNLLSKVESLQFVDKRLHWC
jgi:hypothetical protein